LIVNRVSDATGVCVPCGVFEQNSVALANDLMEQGKLKNMLLVVNDVKEFRRGYGYRYGYRYGYHHGNDKR